MQPASSTKGSDGALHFIMPLIRGLATIFVTGLGMMLSANVGALAYPVGGVGAVIGTIAGGLIFLVIGCCMSGFWRDWLPSEQHGGLTAMLPHAVAVQLGGHGNFKLIITVHEVKNIRVQGRMPWSSPNLYVEIECGNNPVKRTCVKQDMQWGEQFKMQVTALDRSIFVNLKDQEVFGSATVGYVCVDIQNQILAPLDGIPFPCRREFDIEAGEFDAIQWTDQKASIVLSFDRVPEERSGGADEQDQVRADYRADVENQWNQNYGAVQFLKQLEFNPKVQIEREVRK